MAKMYPDSLGEYEPTQSERIVYLALKEQLPDSWEVFYSVTWSRMKNGKQERSEADFIVMNPGMGFIVLEVKGGSKIRIDNNVWYVGDREHEERRLVNTPYEQAEKSMYYLKDLFATTYNSTYEGIFASCAVFPFHSATDIVGLSKRQEELTIDSDGMNYLLKRIKCVFRSCGGKKYGKLNYSVQQYDLMTELVKKRIAISAAAGALVKYKEKQLNVINRVQDNYIYMISNLKQFYIRGGAGTGKTWIAMKLAMKYAELGERVILLCASKTLSEWIRKIMETDNVDIMTYEECLKNIVGKKFNKLKAPDFIGADGLLPDDISDYQYDAIIIDEAQDFNEEWAYIIKMLLRNEKSSHLGVFYDDVQITNGLVFENVFMIDTPPLLLRENIRNTASIYSWASEKTKLGQEVIVNPVEGPMPKKEKMRDEKHLIHRLENIFKEFIDDENLNSSSLVLIVDSLERYKIIARGIIAKWKLVARAPNYNEEIQVTDVESFKGLEADMVIYIHSNETTDNINYIAYTRAKYYLYEFIL